MLHSILLLAPSNGIGLASSDTPSADIERFYGMPLYLEQAWAFGN